MTIKDTEKYILSKQYTKKRIIKSLQKIRFTAADYPIAFIEVSASDKILFTVCSDYKNINQQRLDFPQSITPSKKLDPNKWNTFDFSNVPDEYIKRSIDSAYLFQILKMPKGYHLDD